MKLNVIIVATESENDCIFKEVALRNNFGDVSVTLFFVYGSDQGSLSIREWNRNGKVHYDIFSKYPETFENIVKKTLDAFSYIQEKFPADFYLRTNTSTLIDYKLLSSKLSTFPRESLYAGPFIGNLLQKPFISGMCILMTPDTVSFLIDNQSAILGLKENEDIALSIMMHTRPFTTFLVPRIDFYNCILYHKCFIDAKVWCFRFKTDQRKVDAEKMKCLLDSNFDVDCIPGEKREETPLYSLLFENPFTVV